MADGGELVPLGAVGQGDEIRLDRLPPEMILTIMEIVARLDYESLVQLASVSRRFRGLAPSVRADANFVRLVDPVYRAYVRDVEDIRPAHHEDGTVFQSFINSLSRFPRLGNRQDVAPGRTEHKKVFNLFMFAVLSDNLVLVQQLLLQDAEAGGGARQGGRPHVRLTNYEKHELIGEALYHGFIDIVTYLGSQSWFDPNYVYVKFHSKYDVTPLFIAKNQECVQFLLEKGADATVIGNFGKTPLFADNSYFIRSFTADMITTFVNAGVDVNHTSPRGYTALASHIDERSPLSVIQAFLKSGADPLLSERCAMSAMQHAESLWPDLVDLLRQHTTGKYHGQIASRGVV